MSFNLKEGSSSPSINYCKGSSIGSGTKIKLKRETKTQCEVTFELENSVLKYETGYRYEFSLSENYGRVVSDPLSSTSPVPNQKF